MNTETQALQRIEPLPIEPTTIVKAPITPAQAKIDAVANLTMRAYERASTLILTPEEVAALKADFPDDAFQPGAAGKENLIYIEHAHLRDRLNQVFGPGQWAIVPRNRWAEDFTTGKGSEASRVYVEAMLCIRGCFVAEAVGEMEYWKNNASQNYGDAVEGAKTAALRRCAKELGIGLQAWKKDWCLGWWERRKKGTWQPARNDPAQTTTAQQPARPAQQSSAPSAKQEKWRSWFVAQLHKLDPPSTADGKVDGGWTWQYALEHQWIGPEETLAQMAISKVPFSVEDAEAIYDDIRAWIEARKAENGAGASGPPNTTAAPASGASEAKPEPKKGGPEPDHHSADWYTAVMPWGKQAGKQLGKLDKKYLYGLWKNYTVEVEYNGKPKSKAAIEKDRQFRVWLDQAGVHYRFDEPSPNAAEAPEAEQSASDDDVPLF